MYYVILNYQLWNLSDLNVFMIFLKWLYDLARLYLLLDWVGITLGCPDWTVRLWIIRFEFNFTIREKISTFLREIPSYAHLERYLIIFIYTHKVVISLCLFVCITHEPLDRLSSNFDWWTRENHENVHDNSRPSTGNPRE